MTATLSIGNLKDLVVDSFESPAKDARLKLRNIGWSVVSAIDSYTDPLAAATPTAALSTMRSFMDDLATADPLEQVAFQKLNDLPVAQIKGFRVRR